MGFPVLIYGKSGAGKTRSTKFFGEDEIYYVNIENKPLPFKNTFKYSNNLRNKKESEVIALIETGLMQMSKASIKTAIIDDFGLLMTHIFMDNHRNMKGNAQFDMYNNIADTMYFLISFVKDKLPDDVIVYFMLHEETDDFGNVKFKTIGKLLDQKCQMEAMVTICLRCLSDGKRHFFRTVTDGSDITKAPEDMFQEDEIDNNLKVVDETIRKFYGWGKESE